MEIVPLCDPPHLLKCIRNNFLTKDVEIDFDRPNVTEEDRQYASWQHIITADEIDVYSSFLERHVPSSTEQHIRLDKILKNKSENDNAGFQQHVFDLLIFPDLKVKYNIDFIIHYLYVFTIFYVKVCDTIP